MKKIPVYIISGFLGSGKTTVLLNIVKECEMRNQRSGIILNELGEVNVEGYLFENQNVKELLNGCICCTIKNDLKETLNKFIEEKVKIDVLFIEGTGVANPLEIEETLMDPEYLDHFELNSIISLVDASFFLENQSVFFSTKEVRKLLKEQISNASIILLNKIDLVKEKSITKIEQKIKENSKSEVPIFKTTFGEISMNELLVKRYHVKLPQDQKEKTVKTSHRMNLNETNNHEHHHHHSTINALRIDHLPQLKKTEFEMWLKKLPKSILRGKGIIQLEENGGFFNFQFSSGTLLLERIRENPSIQPTIILIGDGLNKEEIFHNFISTFKIKSY